MDEALIFYALGAAAAAVALPKLKTRLELSKAKHPSLSGHSRMARRIAALVPYYEYDEARIFNCDGAPVDVAARRRAAFTRLAELYRQRFPKGAALTAQAAEGISDLQFTSAYRVPFQFSHYVRQHIKGGSFVESTAGVTVTGPLAISSAASLNGVVLRAASPSPIK